MFLQWNSPAASPVLGSQLTTPPWRVRRLILSDVILATSGVSPFRCASSLSGIVIRYITESWVFADAPFGAAAMMAIIPTVIVSDGGEKRFMFELLVEDDTFGKYSWSIYFCELSFCSIDASLRLLIFNGKDLSFGSGSVVVYDKPTWWYSYFAWRFMISLAWRFIVSSLHGAYSSNVAKDTVDCRKWVRMHRNFHLCMAGHKWRANLLLERLCLNFTTVCPGKT